MEKNNIDALKEKLNNSKKVALISHTNPDGDALGSSAALGIALKKMNIDATVFINDEFPEKYNFLSEYIEFKTYPKDNEQNFDLCFILDCGDEKRLGYSKDIMDKSNTSINIDHHVSNPRFADINIIDSEISSTCELVYNILQDLKIKLGRKIATCIYAGIVTDTGSFSYDNTSSKTHDVVSYLLKAGAEKNKVHYNVYQNRKLDEVKLLGHVMTNMNTLMNNKVTLIEISKKLLNKFNLTYKDVDDAINFARDIKGVEVAVVLKEVEKEEVKIGFRAKNNKDVNKIAKSLGGGGHIKASGATIYKTLDETKKIVLEQLDEFF